MKIKSLFESKFIKVFDLQYGEGRHYYNATRRDEEDLVAAKIMNKMGIDFMANQARFILKM